MKPSDMTATQLLDEAIELREAALKLDRKRTRLINEMERRDGKVHGRIYHQYMRRIHGDW